MRKNQNLPFFIAAVGLFILFKFGYTLADTSDLFFLLQPTDFLVGLLTGSSSVYLSNQGFFHENINIVIDKSCSGFNFWLISFLVFSYISIKNMTGFKHKFLMLPASLITAYGFTIFVNSSRIFVSIIVQSQTKVNFFNHQALIHEVIGISTNLSFLILAYLLLGKLFSQKRNHAKLT